MFEWQWQHILDFLVSYLTLINSNILALDGLVEWVVQPHRSVLQFLTNTYLKIFLPTIIGVSWRAQFWTLVRKKEGWRDFWVSGKKNAFTLFIVFFLCQPCIVLCLTVSFTSFNGLVLRLHAIPQQWNFLFPIRSNWPGISLAWKLCLVVTVFNFRVVIFSCR